MEYFPNFDEDLDESENTTNILQSGGIIGILSNIFRPSSSNSTRTPINVIIDIPSEENPKRDGQNQQHQEEEREEDDQKSSQTKGRGLLNGTKADEQTSLQSNQNVPQCKKNEFRRYWMPDSSGTACYECNDKFSTFRRRHHCRLCGQIFCKGCANRQIDGIDFGYYGVLRLCNFCADQIELHMKTKRHRRDKAKLFVNGEQNGNFSRNDRIQQNGDGAISESTTQFFLEPALTELGFEQFRSARSNQDEHAIDIEVSLSNQPSPSNQNQEKLERMFEEKMEAVLDNLLLREQMESKNWKNLLWTLSRKVAHRVTPLSLASPETENPLEFLHIKKIHMDLDPNFELINGVAISKSLAHSTMPGTMKNVSLMLLSGTISYERILEKFSAIEPIIQQERQFLRLQCDRIMSAHVSLLISENPIPIAVLDLLMAEKISVLDNVKKTVLKRIAEATGTDILTSLDTQFLQPRVGFVPDFSQREFLTSTGQRKRIILLENCTAGNFGPTILLKGRNIRELVAAKRILRFLILARYSSSLEIAFLSLFNSFPLENATGIAFPCHICELNQRNYGGGREKEVSKCEEEDEESTFMAEFSRVQLTNSPVIHFSPPYLKTSLGRQCRLIPYFKMPLFRYLMPADFARLRDYEYQKSAKFEELERRERDNRVENAEKAHRMVDPKMASNPQKLLSADGWINFRSSSALNFRRKAELNRRAREEKLKKLDDLLFESDENETMLKSLAESDVLNVFKHQGIAFLFCAVNSKKTNAAEFCMGPYVLNKTFYDREKDTSLGKFLLSYCFNTEYRCKGCERPMQDHFRRIVHRNTRVEITTHNVGSGNRNSTPSTILGQFGSGAALASGNCNDGEIGGILPFEELPSAIPNNNCQQIICWLRCDSCSANSSIVPMPDAVFQLSFAKFVDYLANGTHWVSPFPSSIDFHQCLHCTFHSHSHFFALGNFVTCFRVSPVYPLNVLFSPIPYAIENCQKAEQNEQLAASIREVLDAKGAQVVDIGSIIAYAIEGHVASKSASEATKINQTAVQQDHAIEVVHSDERHQFTVKIHFADQFQQFRSLIFAEGEKKYIESLATSTPWYPQGGKSGASFFRTENERFVLKTLSRFELDSLRNCAQKYFDYITMAALEHKLTALCKIFGAYGISYTNKQTGQTVKNDYLVMEYIFYKKDIKQIWDLKGSLRNRFASTKPSSSNLNCDSPSSSVLLDENYIQDLWRNQMYLTSHSKAALSQAIINDSNFLANQGIMDYSLLAGISRGQEDEVIIGIVDYMRTFTLDKKVESLVKTALPIGNSPTVISPELYCKRFYERIDGYFAVAPDQWTSESPFPS